ncbi:MAG TPA: DEAD/DEAH box helicase [Marmoricola sp.]|nr:DEAD/DEAH box helicase [Marmoricola sp.]
MTTFRELGVLPEIADALERSGIVTPFPIQEMTLSVALMGTDLIGQARTGTGKTLAFGIPVLQRTVAPHDLDYEELVAAGKPQALVVAPTRELALQVSGDLSLAGADRGIRVLTVYGGVAYEPQLDALTDGVDVVVGTPGRLIDLMNRRALDISHVKCLVLDEADEMLDLGFLPDVERLIAKTPETRQTMLFSATMPAAIVAMARTHMRHPMNIRAESSYDNATVPATAQFIYQAHDLDKPEMIGRMLQAEGAGLTIVFTRTKRQAQRIADDLVERGFKASPLHGDMAQVAREKALTKFREGKIQVLVATDVAARGIDVHDVTHVVNYTCPEDEKTYIHRIGRTGRAGATGIAVTFVDWADLHRWKMINKALDLPFDDPAETYSSSEHFFHDMGIPAGTKGRVVPEGTIEVKRPKKDDRAPRSGAGRSRSRSGAEKAAPERASEDKPRSRNRRRRRTRGGNPAASDAS